MSRIEKITALASATAAALEDRIRAARRTLRFAEASPAEALKEELRRLPQSLRGTGPTLQLLWAANAGPQVEGGKTPHLASLEGGLLRLRPEIKEVVYLPAPFPGADRITREAGLILGRTEAAQAFSLGMLTEGFGENLWAVCQPQVVLEIGAAELSQMYTAAAERAMGGAPRAVAIRIAEMRDALIRRNSISGSGVELGRMDRAAFQLFWTLRSEEDRGWAAGLDSEHLAIIRGLEGPWDKVRRLMAAEENSEAAHVGLFEADNQLQELRRELDRVLKLPLSLYREASIHVLQERMERLSADYSRRSILCEEARAEVKELARGVRKGVTN